MFRSLSQPNINYKESILFKTPNPQAILGDGFIYYRVDYNYILAEIQFSWISAPDNRIVLNSSNGITFTRLSASPQFNVGALNDNAATSATNQYVGSSTNTNHSYRIELSISQVIHSVWLVPQISNGVAVNIPTYLKLFNSLNGTNWIQQKEWIVNSSNMLANQYNRFIV